MKQKDFKEVLELHQKRFDSAIEPYKDKQPYKRLCINLISINMDLMRYLRGVIDKDLDKIEAEYNAKYQ